MTQKYRHSTRSNQKKLLPAMSTIVDALNSKTFTPLERQRFEDDLNTLKERLTSREYLQSSFKPRNQLSIPERTEEFYKDLGFFYSVGKVWQTLLTKVDCTSARSVLDIGPGYFPKVELGLYYAGFSGRVTLLDHDPLATASASRFLSFFDCNFSLRCAHTSILSAPRAKYDLIVANHFLDDFGLTSHCKEHQIDIQEAYLSERLYRALWNDIAQNSEFALSEVRQLAATLSRILAPGGSILPLDYTSFSHQALGLVEVPAFVKKMRSLLTRELSQHALAPHTLITSKIRCDRLQISNKDLMCVTSKNRRSFA